MFKFRLKRPSKNRVNSRPVIQKALDKKGIKYEFYETKGYLDAFNFIKGMDIDKFSALLAVGGDGIIHEVINGMMRREDSKKIPIGLIPNGSGNDTCHCF